jgi:hypothetical protein
MSLAANETVEKDKRERGVTKAGHESQLAERAAAILARGTRPTKLIPGRPLR